MMLKGCIQLEVQGELAFLARLDMADEYAVCQRGEGSTGIQHPVHHKAGGCHGLGQVQFTLVLLHLALQIHLDVQVCHRQEPHAAGTRHEILVDESLCLLLLALEDEPSHLRQICQGLLAVVVVRTAAPESLLVQLDSLVERSAKYHRPEVRVADGQCLQPVAGRSIIPQLGGMVCLDRLGRYYSKQGTSQEGNHSPLFFIYHFSLVLKIWTQSYE